ncbi:MAG: RNA polymerase sigma factor [Clostridia bacterium]|nr:RNA polymerase sigma factor [Clostridia bacterium]
MDEKLLIEKSIQGDSESFEKLILSCEKKVYNIALKILGNEADAYDAAQDTFIKVYKNLEKFKGNSSFSTWVYRITSNVCLDIIRKNKNKKNTVSIDKEIEFDDSDATFEIEDRNADTEEKILEKERSEALHKALSRLNPEQREILVLREFQNLSYDEIANVLNIGTGTVKSKISRARAALKNELLKNKELFLSLFVLLIWK